MSNKRKETSGGPRSDTDVPVSGDPGPLLQPVPDHGSMERLKNWLLEDDESSESWLGDLTNSMVGPEAASHVLNDDVDIIHATVSDSSLLEGINELRRQNSELRKQLEIAIEGLPNDQASILKKEMELMDREENLQEREKGIEESIITSSNKEPGLEERFQEELREKDDEFRKRETEFNQRIEQIEKELEETESEIRLRDEELRLAKMNGPEVEREFEEKLKELRKKEQFVSRLEEEVKNLRAEMVQKEEELKKINELLKFKDSEFGHREEDLLFRERKMEEERRRFEEAKKEASGLEELEMRKRLESLKDEIQAKEQEIVNKEKYLSSKESELRRREHRLINEEIEAREEERAVEIQQAKVKTGNHRFDDLLLGGIPFGSNILVHGPPFTGKEVMMGQFVTEGLIKGVPCIWVLTDKTPSDIREEMKFIISGYEEYEKLGLVSYIDTYSMSMGQTTEDPYTVFIDDPTDHKKIMDIVEKKTQEYLEGGHQYYRLAFRSLSTLIAYSDPISTFRFMSPFCGKRKRDKAVSMFAMEKGMHGDQEIQMIGSVMDGMIDFKIDQLKTFFAVKGITDVQSRSYIRYTATKSALSIGSFSLDHIR
ncbi:MAG TPA: ATPase domain-containing protein [Methanomassiliicoccales archaeon]|nr:ATPase domain-containing protein [Methanomassiliicoccales archaeon]